MARRVPPYDIIYEGLLEMHFHSAIIRHFANLYGLNFLKLLKPSPRKEAWVGFDQGWVYSTVPTGQLFNDLQTAIQTNSTSASKLYIGYFMQFKIGRKLQRKSDYKPSGFPSPYFRAEVDLTPNKTTGISQHETLMRLCNVANASVCYACGMLFDLADLYVAPDLRKLRAVPVSGAPTGWNKDERHFIAFRHSTDAKPKWCSDPVDGESLSFDEWAVPNSKYGPKALSPEAIFALIKSAVNEVDQKDISNISNRKKRGAKRKKERPQDENNDLVTKILPESFTLLEFDNR